jgi:hypothetical protein
MSTFDQARVILGVSIMVIGFLIAMWPNPPDDRD